MPRRPCALADAEAVVAAAIDPNLSALALAHVLIGWALATHRGEGWAAGIIVEAEAYDTSCAASHSYRGLRPGNRAMFGPAGHLYVYRSYGLHWCLNITAGPPGDGAAVLVRALAPLSGQAIMARRRGLAPSDRRLGAGRLCAGPGNLARALAIDGDDDGLALGAGAVSLWRWPGRAPPTVEVGPRIGISRQAERPWRVVDPTSPAVSGPRRRLARRRRSG